MSSPAKHLTRLSLPRALADGRSAGVLLHPTSLPGPFGIGDLGPAAERFLDWATSAGLRVWQTLPLGPTNTGGSPYDGLSADAGNPWLISPELLVHDGLLTTAELEAEPPLPEGRVDFPAVAARKEHLLRRAFTRAGSTWHDALADFAKREAEWLDDACLFAAIAHHLGTSDWPSWPAGLARREEADLAAARRELADELAYRRFVEGVFDRQWRRLRAAARRRGLGILGDVPFYVALESPDVWRRPELFDLDEGFRPRTLGGVPPDAFSADGQLWNLPTYRWDRMAADGHAWWARRLATQLRRFDALRLDHFRGFLAFWRVPATAPTAATGEWVEGPGRALFNDLARRLGDEIPGGELPDGELPWIAEDLGVITPDVEGLRRELGLPGLGVLQFGFDDAQSPHHPDALDADRVAYTGTHDNDTLRGWLADLDADARRRVEAACGPEAGQAAGGELATVRALIRRLLDSPARLAILPMQDALELGSEARMNIPGVATGNWAWRLRPDELDGEAAAGAAKRLRRWLTAAGRGRPVPAPRDLY